MEDVLDKCQFIVLAPNQWDGQWMNRQQIFSRVGLYSEVVYSRGIPYIWELKSPVELSASVRSHIQHCDNIRVDTPSTLLFRWPRLGKLSNLMLRAHSRKLVSLLSPDKLRILYIFHPDYAGYAKTIKHDLMIYHPYDDFSKQGGSGDLLKTGEKSLLKNADIVITPSTDVSQNLMRRSGRKIIHTIHNGVDFDRFSQGAGSPCPEDLGRIPGKKVGYIGSINVKVDIELLLYLSENLAEEQLVLIGPVGNLGNKQPVFNTLVQRPNVHLLGSKDYRDLPAYAGHMDCHLMCYDTSPALWARYAYPLKLNEYLATGKPLVSCELTSVPDQEQLMDVCKSPEEWLAAVSRNLMAAGNKTETGYAYASDQSWGARVKELSELLAKYTQNPESKC